MKKANIKSITVTASVMLAVAGLYGCRFNINTTNITSTELESTSSADSTETLETTSSTSEDSYIVEDSYDSLFNTEFSFSKYIPNGEAARLEIANYGRLSRDEYDNSQVEEIETQLEEDYDILAVNLGDMDLETVNAVKAACDYVFSQYPQMKGFITNISLCSDISDQDSVIAMYKETTFVESTSGDSLYPFVNKNQILLGDTYFLNPTKLSNTVKRGIIMGQWTKGTTVETLIVHEFGHAWERYITAKRCGLEDSVYINEENADEYGNFTTQLLSDNQATAKEICETAYENYKSKYESDITYTEFCATISEYAIGTQADGGISYTETCAEAFADKYVHGEDMTQAASEILDVMDSFYADERE